MSGLIWVQTVSKGNQPDDTSRPRVTGNSFPAVGNFCGLLITFPNSLDPDQTQQNVGPALDPIFLTLVTFLKEK